ncbi:MAG: hypothetical protein S4CHLAM102_13850 [Chlamydiia bacterium]|nr:hypothetical protein [Chlamydiia bacterium]
MSKSKTKYIHGRAIAINHALEAYAKKYPDVDILVDGEKVPLKELNYSVMAEQNHEHSYVVIEKKDEVGEVLESGDGTECSSEVDFSHYMPFPQFNSAYGSLPYGFPPCKILNNPNSSTGYKLLQEMRDALYNYKKCKKKEHSFWSRVFRFFGSKHKCKIGMGFLDGKFPDIDKVDKCLIAYFVKDQLPSNREELVENVGIYDEAIAFLKRINAEGLKPSDFNQANQVIDTLANIQNALEYKCYVVTYPIFI